MEKKSASMLDQIIRYENGEMEHYEVVELFQGLIETGQAWTLQGHYGRMAIRLMEMGLVSPSKKTRLRKTGETHSNGWPIYMEIGKTKTYYFHDGDDMYVCGDSYRDEFGTFDGEPLWSINNYIIIA